MIEDRKHLDWNDLASLADSGPESVDSAVLEHLAGCSECQAAWAEAARYRGARLLEGDEYFVPEELANRARALIGADAHGGRQNSRSLAPVGAISSRFWRPAPVFSAGGVLLAAVLALFVLFPGLRDTGQPDRPSDPRTVIFSVLESQSAWGMVYPGVTGSGDSGYPVYRSGNGTDASLQEALDLLEESGSTGPRDADDVWWLAAGYATAGRLGLASDLVHQALRRDPDHLRLLHLEAITAWQLSEFDRAEHALLRILAQAPTDSTALFNLALMQIENGRPDLADPLLRRLAAGSNNNLLQRRAQEVLDSGSF